VGDDGHVEDDGHVGMMDNGSEPQLGTVLGHNGGFTMGNVDVNVDIQGTLMMDINVQGTQGMRWLSISN